MNQEDWREIERLYQAATELPPDRQADFLATECGSEDVRREVESLLAHRAHGLSFIDRLALDVVGDMAEGNQAQSLVGQTLGRYQVTSLIGTGGMGIVYRARDTRLGRDVALKLLPVHLSHDSDRQSRAEREARLLASLNHPNIAAIYDLDESIRCLVLEFVEGETLAERLSRGPLSLRESFDMCRQIAEALEAAHEHGIVHRDLKPANVMITSSGSVKVLDFGIAKMLAPDPSSTTPASATFATGAVVGTPAYMSPEQARGRPADKRTDIWAFGCVLYESLTGKNAFKKETVTDTLAAIVDAEPDWSALPKGTPPGVVNLLRRCLNKNPRWRLRDIGDARIELADDRLQTHTAATVAAPVDRRLVLMAGVTTAALIAALVALLTFRPVIMSPEMRVEITTPQSPDPVSLAISPDGAAIAFVATHEGRSRLWLRALDSTSPRPLEGTEGASCPFWSPDNNSVGFFADGRLKRIDVDTGSVRTLVIALSCGGTWGSDNTILFSSPLFGPISRISASGGTVSPVTSVPLAGRVRQTSHRFPQFLPDGRHFLFYTVGSPDTRGIYVGNLDGAEPRRLLDADSAAVYQSTGHLLFVRQGMLFAQGFDPTALMLRGTPFPVNASVAFDATRYIAAISTSSTGVIAYRPGSSVGRRQFVWLDRAGNEIAKVGEPDSAGPLDPSLSRDERQIALYRTENGRADIWLLEPGRAVLTRFTSQEITGASGAVRPIWSAEGSEIVFASGQPTQLFRRSVTGGTVELLLKTDQPKAATDWSTDDRFILYRSSDPKTSWDIWALPLDESRRPQTPIQLVRTNFDETNGQFSPDSKWIAYQSNETGRFEIYVQPFPGPGRKWRISRDGGAQVRWRRDGKELFYVSLDDRLMAVPIHYAPDGESIETAPPTPLFATHIGGAVQGADRQQYMPSSDGLRFLMNSVLEEPTSPITLLLNWQPNPR